MSEVAFVGGCTTAMLVTDDAVLEDIRFTDDVDLVIELAGIAAWERLTHRLAAKGFKITGEDEVNCRFRFNDIIVDVMPSDEAVLERVRKGQESVHSAADVRKDLGLDD